MTDINTRIIYCNRTYYVAVHMLAAISVAMILYFFLAVQGIVSPFGVGHLATLKLTEQQIKAEMELARLRRANADEFGGYAGGSEQ